MNHAKTNRDDQTVLALSLASIGCAAAIGARSLYTGRVTYVFFAWNLFLAWVPLVLSLALVRRHRPGTKSDPASWALGVAWLAFFPNAPYLVTDLVHLRPRAPVPLWLDALLVFAFGLTGLCLAFVSLRLVQGLVERRRGVVAGWLFVALVSGLTGVGIYLGRFHRWNSWDLVTRPQALLSDAAGWAREPLANLNAVAAAVILGAMFGVSYLLLFAVSRMRVRDADQSVPASVGQSP
jgi:uncharacterized membrane protein